MSYARSLSPVLLFNIFMLSTLRPQDVVLPGSTVQGDILRGQGQFLKGAAWYELNAAKARELDARTAHAMEQWNREIYDAYQRELAASAARKRSVRNERFSDAKKRQAERQDRLRTRPTDDDVQSGDALNALLLDLSDPSISESSWRYAKVPLPESLAIARLIFQFAARRGDRNSQALTKSLIALGRLDLEGRWPAYLAIDELSRERWAYERAYAKVKAESLAGKLTLGAVLEFAKAVEALERKARSAVPTARNFRTAAVQAVDGLKKTTGMFDASTIGFAEEMIADTHNHRAQTVGELLAFMRKYRLLFAPADKRPEDAEQYLRLYRLLRQQKELFGQKTSAAPEEPIAGDWVPLFNGRDLSGWAAFQNGRPVRLGANLVADRGEISCSASTHGRLETASVSPGFVFKLEYSFPEGGKLSDLGSGIALIPENPTAAFQVDGTTIVGLLECQLKPGQSGGLGLAWQPMTVPRRAETERPAGEWNEIEIRYEGPKLTIGLNGAVVNQVVLEQYWPCHIALLAQGSDVHFRNVRIIPSKSGRSLDPVQTGNQPASLRDSSVPSEGTAFRLINVKTGKALDVKDGSTQPGAALVQSAVSNRQSQLWTVRPSQGSLLLVNTKSGHSVNIPRASNLNRQPLIQWNVMAGRTNQSWVFQKQRTALRIISRQNNLVIAAPDVPDDGGPIVQLFPKGGENELWQVVVANR